MMIKTIPVVLSTSTVMTVDLASRLFDLSFYFNDRIGRWFFDITDARTRAVIGTSIALVVNTDLLSPYIQDVGVLFMLPGPDREDPGLDLSEVVLAHAI